MINVTERAKEELRSLLLRSVDWPGARLRLLEKDSGKLGLGVDIEGASDEVLEHDGERILIVEGALASRLDDITLDVDDTPDGIELVICEQAKV